MTTPASDLENSPDFKAETLESDARASHLPRSRIPIFLTVILTILMGANWFVRATWNHFWKSAGSPVWEMILPALTITFIASMFLGWRYSGLWLRVMYRVSATGMGVLNFAFFAAGAAWIFSWAAALLSLHIEPGVVAAAFAAAAGLASLYGLVNGSLLRVTRVTVALAGLPSAWQGRSVALVTDMHLGNVRGAGFTRRVVARLQQFQPEAVFICGDMFDGVKADFAALVEPWKGLSTPGGIYFVRGNHEEFDDSTKFVAAVKGAGIRVLDNEKVEIDSLQIVGIHDGATDDPRLFKSLLQRANLDRSRASILLAHRPGKLAIPAGEGITLQLSGHTHGGQIWPWHWLAARVHGKFNHGLNRFGQMQVFTSYGAGTWGVPMRVRTKSEIVLIRLEREQGDRC
jgi:predicted MPP superfamily phosphohydrolase